MTADPEPQVSLNSDQAIRTTDSWWDPFLWPRWLPVRMRMPVVAQITGAVALTALFIGPWWASIPRTTPIPQSNAAPPPTAPLPAAVPRVPAAVARETPVRPAHLNLDVRHTFNTADVSVTVDGKPALETRIEGSGKRFKVFGKRAERTFTKTLDLTPGARVVGVRVRSAADKFDQTRVERFDLESAMVAGLQVSADRSGLALVAVRPPAPAPARAATPAPAAAAPPPAPATSPVAVAVARGDALAATAQVRQEASATADILQSMRSMLIAIAGFIASTATAFVIQEFLRSRRDLIFADDDRQRQRRGAPSV